ncbi:Gpi1-domain-containing protein [Saitoella complicata NRRL Y-17804]|uniref:Gpi1-domain-containing protein n=1 Tax=Saitoella complicata (strain BCRC 22490 / CBS 7301 / JCM 7358 / NBRC 10748 / NRRL Y-17804) TaxID=698492 RepID=UPI000866E3ED|nr:Gpi1-domain-containing protein [Saitoella complicata NRRL Y-17804]ODQ56522.1 Gpi1-domain-containing protein [Saitoella complicata NRRL Y-17804]
MKERRRGNNCDGEAVCKKDGSKIVRIFWPAGACRKHDVGLLVGWRVSDLDVFVLAVLPEVNHTRLATALRDGLLFSQHDFSKLQDLCGGHPLSILGSLNDDIPRKNAYTGKGAWIVGVTHDDNLVPEFTLADPTMSATAQVILFDPPNPHGMHFYSLQPTPLDFGGLDAHEGRDRKQQLERQQRRDMVLKKLAEHTPTRRLQSQPKDLIQMHINKINCSYELGTVLHENAKRIGMQARRKRTLSVGERVRESAETLQASAWEGFVLAMVWMFRWVMPYVFLFTRGIVMLERLLIEALLHFVEWQPFPNHPPLKDLLGSAQQAHIRMQQACQWPVQCLALRDRKKDWASMTTNHMEYIRFYNSLWLVGNDAIIGAVIASYLTENADEVASLIERVSRVYTIESLHRMILWLMDWPAGLKLNNELAAFLGDLFIYLINFWAVCMGELRPYLPFIVRFVGYSGFVGASMAISLSSDLLTLLTLHISSFYIASARIYNWQLTILVSLFHLFRGKKHNVLRERIDSCDYDLDQLLLGTILFTLLSFLFPTVLVFYATFAVCHMGIVMLKALSETLLACLNHFPLFPLMLRIKDPKRLPGGIRFELYTGPRRGGSTNEKEIVTSYVALRSTPLPLKNIFRQYLRLARRLRAHYLNPGVFVSLAIGRPVPLIPRSQLAGSEERRISVEELWKKLEARRRAS